MPTILAPVKKASLLVRNRGQGSVHRSADSPWFLLGGLLACWSSEDEEVTGADLSAVLA